MIRFYSPYFLILLLLLPILFFRRDRGAIEVASVEMIRKQVRKSRKDLIGKVLIYTALVLMIIALARPQNVKEVRDINREGIDIVVSLDLSRSMMQDDFKPDRLEAAKRVLVDFIGRRPDDRISLVIFGGEAYTKVPLTLDHRMLRETVENLGIEDITSNDRTAIGMGMGVALNRVKESEAKSKVVILMTDGENNSGMMSPMGAANIAKELGVKVYTIGIGAREYEVDTLFGKRSVENTQLDEGLLESIAAATGGRYFRAADSRGFEDIFREIDSLEKTKIEAKSYHERREYYSEILGVALILLVLGFICQKRYMMIP